MDTRQQNLAFQKIVTITAVILFFGKIIAWKLTSSVAILTDALESTINIVSGFVGLYSLYISAQPKDYNHPYGHGKVEFVSAAIEGILIFAAGLIIIYEATINLSHPHTISRLDYGIFLVTVSAIINFIVGGIAIKKGRKNNSLPLIATGKHLQSDTYSTIGIIIGLVLIAATGLLWIDSLVALIFAVIIIVTGVKILRRSLAGIMDEADDKLLAEVVAYLNEIRQENWVDLHNLRIIKYGSILHLDCHLTVPWFLNVNEAHKEVEVLSMLLRSKYGSSVELFVHTDGCLDFSCKVCSKSNCEARKNNFIHKIEWSVENISQNKKHQIN